MRLDDRPRDPSDNALGVRLVQLGQDRQVLGTEQLVVIHQQQDVPGGHPDSLVPRGGQRRGEPAFTAIANARRPYPLPDFRRDLVPPVTDDNQLLGQVGLNEQRLHRLPHILRAVMRGQDDRYRQRQELPCPEKDRRKLRTVSRTSIFS